MHHAGLINLKRSEYNLLDWDALGGKGIWGWVLGHEE